MNNTLREWMTVAPHFADCVAIPAQSDRACTCGKREALIDLENLEAAAPGEADHV